MKAVVKAEPKPGIVIRDVPKPQLGMGEVLVEVKAGGVCGSDLHMDEWVGQGYDWMHLPLIMGHEFAGRVAEIDRNVKDVQVDDRVSVTPHVYCGTCHFCKDGRFNLCLNRALKIGFTRDGGFAEYISVPAQCIYKLPPNLSYEMGAIVEPLCVALHGTEVARPEPGDAIAILGAGPIGLLEVQTSKIAGAGPIMVTGLGRDEGRLALAKELGAVETVNVQKEDPIAIAKNLTAGLGIDVVYELSGSPAAFKQGLRMLRRGGRLILIGLSMGVGEIAPISDVVRAEIILQGSFNYVPRTWERAMKLLERGRVELKPLITHQLPLEKATEGFELARSGQATKVLLTP